MGGEEAVAEESSKDQTLIIAIIINRYDPSGPERFILANELRVIHYNLYYFPCGDPEAQGGTDYKPWWAGIKFAF